MKLMKRSGNYKSKNVVFFTEEIKALSYDWWCFVKVINGKVVFNSYNYSPTTNKHQSKVRTLLDELNIKIDIEVSCPRGLQDSEFLNSIENFYTGLIDDLNDLIKKPRSQKKKNEERKKTIKDYKSLWRTVKKDLGLKVEIATDQEILKAAIDSGKLIIMGIK